MDEVERLESGRRAGGDHRRRAYAAGARTGAADAAPAGRGYTVLLETSGERPLERVPRRVIKIVDVKCPDSGEPDTFHMENLDCAELAGRGQVRAERSRRLRICPRLRGAAPALDERVNAVLFSPAFSKEASGARDASHCLLDPRELAEWMLADGVPARLGLQIHKFIWDPAMKGV